MQVRVRYRSPETEAPAQPVKAAPRPVLVPRPQPAAPRSAEPEPAAAPAEVVSLEEMASAIAALLTPAFALTLAIAVWRLGQDLGFASSFFITEGVWSHWQVWFALAMVIQLASTRLNRRARPASAEDEPATN